MSPFLSYSGRGRSQRARGRGVVGRGRGRAGRGNSIDRRSNLNRNKWVRPSASAQTNHDTGDYNVQESVTKNDPKNASLSDTQAGPESNSMPISKYSHRIMKKTGRHKLVLTSKTIVQPVASVESMPERESNKQKTSTQGQTLKREGRNKLVSLVASNVAKPMVEKPRASINLHPMDRKYKNVIGCQKVRPPPKIPQPTAKRVKLQVQPSASEVKEGDSGADSEGRENLDSTDNSAASNSETTKPNVSDSKPKPEEKLSDFAYREVSRVRQRQMISGRSLRWSKNDSSASSNETHSDKVFSQPSIIVGNPSKSPKIKSMGLVRVQPDEKTTPICPNFLRGLHCQNPFCRKRHDIPKEYAMPVCSFFQKHGQCLRGDTCQFRHVKLNANALVCPSFAILGFCEDRECKMQHVRGPKAATAAGNNDNNRLTTRRSSSRQQRKPNNVYYRNKSGSGGRNKDAKT